MTTADETRIAQVVQLYIDGSADGDAGKLKEAFHDDARMFGHVDGHRFDVPIQQFFEFAACLADERGGQLQGEHHLDRAGGRCGGRDARRGWVLGTGVVRRLLLAGPLRRHVEDREQDVCAHGRGDAAAVLTAAVRASCRACAGGRRATTSPESRTSASRARGTGTRARSIIASEVVTVAIAVAARFDLSISAISPKTSPSPAVSTVWSPMRISTAPLTTPYM